MTILRYNSYLKSLKTSEPKERAQKILSQDVCFVMTTKLTICAETAS